MFDNKILLDNNLQEKINHDRIAISSSFRKDRTAKSYIW